MTRIGPSPLALAILSLGALAVSACATTTPPPSRAPAPARPVDAATFYMGVWHEIARNPMKLTDGCVAGETRFYRKPDGRLIDRDSCRKDTPQGNEKVFEGPVTILDPGVNAKFHTAYKVYGLFTVGRDYWVLDHGPDWFIVASPSFEDLAIFTRSPRIPAERRAMLVGVARALGYDVARLEFPAQP